MMARGEVVCATCELHAEAVFRVEGMDCTEEVVILERRLKPLAGIEAVSADVIGQRLHVKYDAAKLTTSAMVDAVGQTGMRMWLEHEQPRSSASDVRARLWLTLAAGFGIVASLVLSAAGLDVVARGLLAAATVAGGFYPARRALMAMRTRSIDINVLMVIAVCGALVLGEWLEAASVVFLFSVAQWLEVRTLERARQAIRTLIDLAPREALVKRDGVERWVPVDEVVPGEMLVVRPGDKIPIDGRVQSGHGDVNEAPITGESLPVDKEPGDEVYAGTINGHGALEILVTRVGRDTRLARIIHLVEDAQSRRAPVQSFVDRFARIYTPIVVVLAVVVALLPPLVIGADPSTWVYRALVLLVVACPCALVISTPVSIVAALSAAARNGVLIKGGAHLERLADVSIVAFDKTGTLTHGTLTVTDLLPTTAAGASDLLSLAAAVEARSEHPIGRAVAEHARRLRLELPAVVSFRSMPGLGAEGRVLTAEAARREVDGGRSASGRPVASGLAEAAESRNVTVGNERLFVMRGIAQPQELDAFARLRREGKSLTFVALDGVFIGAIAVADRARDAARDTVELLRSHGIRRVVMLTGDHPDTAGAVAARLGLDEHHAGLLPEQKHALVQSMRGADGAVLMVGDGVNDAPALAVADVGMAMGAAGSDAALETADVALMSDELSKIPYALRLSRATLRNIKTNVAVSLILKAAFLVLAVTGVATLWMAVLADTGASVIVVANALRLLRTR
jgi:Zn2+/Cd2+-exporting ATPase